MADVSGGSKLKAALAEIGSRIRSAKEVEVGFIDRATYPDGTPVALVAAANEFGTAKIPPRPFFRNMIRENSSKWPVNLKTALKETGYDAATSLGQLGKEIEDELQDSIRSNTPPPNSESTLKSKAKRHASPRTLIDSGDMLNTVKHNVK